MYRVVFSGSRHWTDAEMVYTVIKDLREEHGPELEVVVGDAHGADAAVLWISRVLEVEPRVFEADWKPNGQFDKLAGIKRNKKMVQTKPNEVIAFRAVGKSNGTDNCIKLAQEAGIEVREYRS